VWCPSRGSPLSGASPLLVRLLPHLPPSRPPVPAVYRPRLGWILLPVALSSLPGHGSACRQFHWLIHLLTFSLFSASLHTFSTFLLLSLIFYFFSFCPSAPGTPPSPRTIPLRFVLPPSPSMRRRLHSFPGERKPPQPMVEGVFLFRPPIPVEYAFSAGGMQAHAVTGCVFHPCGHVAALSFPPRGRQVASLHSPSLRIGATHGGGG
jgi:hypothetical protein